MWSLMERGGPLMWPLLLCSLVSLTVIIERLLFWWRERWNRDTKLREAVLTNTSHGAWEEALALGRSSRDSLIKVICTGLAHRELGMETALEIAASDYIDRMKRGLGILDTIITVAPLVGILGTVSGIIKSFDLLGQMGVEDPTGVTAGIAEALITTATGLSIAIPSVLAFNYFQSKMSKTILEMEKYINSLQIVHTKGLVTLGNNTQKGKPGPAPQSAHDRIGIPL